jgi:outer membrane receptor protein involved in Fe transport
VGANSYAADDDLTALYAMADLGPVSWLRIVGGLRVEDWRLNVFVPDRTASIDPFRRNRDYLWSSNLTLLLSDRVNLRLAGFRSVVRPDARELTPEVYFPVGGECGLIGNPRVQRAIALNGDAKIEFFPSVGELISISGYYKRITRPLLTAIGSSATGCRVGFINGASAIVYGGEFEVRKRLVGGLSANLNFSYVYSQATLDSSFSFAAARVVKPPLQGQSPYILNAGVNYDNPGLRLGIAVLFNYFADRVYQYGVIGISGSTVTPAADQIEEARGTLDVKVTKGVGPFGISVSGRNLTNEPFLVTQKVVGEVIPVVQYRRGYDLSLGVSYDF